ncbi:hypothetical protein [Mucilaginibacter sp. dw_454]|uniref:hypothetical protein n=1 Tax=Mucilaginibacter sp. dw_454 TaxID=2720079 RepID=UPI001BD49CA4|nr:hypothetical protein [Mucilaginibacter sp. dw_454]
MSGSETVFPVLSYGLQDEHIANGSAFFINNKGVFITAAHTFKNSQRQMLASLNGKVYTITEIWQEYLPNDDQSAPLYRDLFIGMVDSYVPNDILELGSDVDMKTGQSLEVSGWNTTDYSKPTAPVHANDLFESVISDYQEDDDEHVLQSTDNENDLNLNLVEQDKLTTIDDLHSYLHSDNDGNYTVSTNEMVKISKLIPDVLDAKFVRYNFRHINKYSEYPYEFLNGFTIKLDVPEPHGYSGGPLLLDNKVVGMLIGEEGAISVSYIKERLNEPAIKNIVENMSPQFALPETDERMWAYQVIKNVHSVLLSPGSSYTSQASNILYVLKKDIHLLLTPVPSLILEGFGGTEGNHYWKEKHKLVNLIVIDDDLIRAANLTDEEAEAVVVHELGHVLNMYEVKHVPNPLDSVCTQIPYDPNVAAKVNAENNLNKELYADNYAHQTGWKLSLLRSFEKYLTIGGAKNKEMFESRSEALENAFSKLPGVIRPLRQISDLN